MGDWYPNNSISPAAYTGGIIGQFANYGQNLNPGYGALGAQQVAYGMPSGVNTTGYGSGTAVNVGAPQIGGTSSVPTPDFSSPEFFTDADFTDPTVNYGYLIAGNQFWSPESIAAIGAPPANWAKPANGAYGYAPVSQLLANIGITSPITITPNGMYSTQQPSAPSVNTSAPSTPAAGLTPLAYAPWHMAESPYATPKSSTQNQITDLARNVANATKGITQSPAQTFSTSAEITKPRSTDVGTNQAELATTLGGGGIGKSTTYKSPWLAYGGWKF